MRWFISNASFSLYGRVGRADLYSSTRRHYRNASDVSACFVFVSNNTILFSSYDFFFFFFFFHFFLLFFFILRLFFPLFVVLSFCFVSILNEENERENNKTWFSLLAGATTLSTFPCLFLLFSLLLLVGVCLLGYGGVSVCRCVRTE